MKNFEQITATVESMRDFLAKHSDCERCPAMKYCNDMSCKEALKKWLESEVEE